MIERLVLAALAVGLFGGHAAAESAPGFVLAASWEPAFCATSAGRDKAECLSETPDSPSATRLSLHGLWPDDLGDKAIFPCYCDRGEPRSCRESLPAGGRVDLSPTVMAALKSVMPGTQSGLERHEWAKHGTCYGRGADGTGAGATPDEYFSDAAALIDKLNASAVGALFASHVGAVLTAAEIDAAFDEAFGAGAAERVIVDCNGSGKKAVIAELRINLAGNITPDSDLGALILAAPPTKVSTNERSCQRGRVQRVAQ